MSFVCDIYGFEFPDDREREFDGQQLCHNCLNIHTLLCRECGQRFWRTDNAGTEEFPLCPSCYEEHYPEIGAYLYASTKPILERALQQLPFALDNPIQIPLNCGEILQITAKGEERGEPFDDSKLLCGLTYGRYTAPSWWGFGGSARNAESGHLAALKSVAGYFGIAPWEIDRLIEAGFTEEEIEEYLYGGEM